MTLQNNNKALVNLVDIDLQTQAVYIIYKFNGGFASRSNELNMVIP